MEPPQNRCPSAAVYLCIAVGKNGIPKFSVLVSPLYDSMEIFYAHSVKRTKPDVARNHFTAFGWSSEQLDAFESCKNALENQVTLSYRDGPQRHCVYTDASDTVWSGIVTQAPLEDFSKLHSEQSRSALAILSGRFNSTQLVCFILEKEAFVVLATLEYMHWVAATPSGLGLFTDHNNLIFLFDPLSVVPDMSKRRCERSSDGQ